MTMKNEGGLLAGVGRRCVAPPVGTLLAGQLRDGVSEAVLDELTITALYLRHGATQVLVISCDLILMPPEEAMELRKTIGETVSIPTDAILLNFSHSHATPSPVTWGEYDYAATAEHRAPVVEFFATFAEATVGAAQTAIANSAPARVGSAVGSSDINVNRRERKADGTLVLGSNPEAAVDREVGIIRIDGCLGKPLAMLLNYACHPDVLGPKSSLISADFVGPAREAAEAVTAATTLFLQGAAGDVYPATGIVDGQDGTDVAARLGHRLGAEAARVFETINTSRRPRRRLEWISASSVTTHWEYEDIPESTFVDDLQLAHTVLQLPLRDLPSQADAQDLVVKRESELADLTSHDVLSSRLIAHRRLAWAKIQLDAVIGNAELSLPVELQVIRIGDAALVAIPGELFTEIGMAIKAASPFRTTLICAYSNGIYFYIPTKAAFAEGGYEINSHQNYLRISGPTADWEESLITESIRLLNSLI